MQIENGVPAAGWPERLDDLTRAERLLVGGLRRWLAGLRQNDGAHWRVVSVEFAAAFGAAAGTAPLALFGRAVQFLYLDRLRPIRCNPPCGAGLTEHEGCFALLVAACQHGDARLGRAAAGWLVAEEAVGDLLATAASLAAAMRRSGLLLPRRWRAAASASPRPPASPTGATLH